jgi:hypothetical protein
VVCVGRAGPTQTLGSPTRAPAPASRLLSPVRGGSLLTRVFPDTYAHGAGSRPVLRVWLDRRADGWCSSPLGD